MRSRGTRGGIEKEGAAVVEMKQDVKTPERRVILVCNVYHLVWKGEEMRQPQPTKVTRRKNADGQILSAKDPGCEPPGKDAIVRKLLGRWHGVGLLGCGPGDVSGKLGCRGKI